MELFVMTLVIPMFGIFGALMGGLVKNLGLGKVAKKDGVPLPPPVGGILPTVAQLFQQRAKAKRQQQSGSEEGSTPPSTADMATQGAPSDFFRRLSEGASNSSWTGRQLFGRMRGSGLGGDGFWSKIIEEAVRKQRGGQ